METHEKTGCCTEKQICYADKKGNEVETDSKISPIHQETQVEEVMTQYNNSSGNNDQKKSITLDKIEIDGLKTKRTISKT